MFFLVGYFWWNTKASPANLRSLFVLGCLFNILGGYLLEEKPPIFHRNQRRGDEEPPVSGWSSRAIGTRNCFESSLAPCPTCPTCSKMDKLDSLRAHSLAARGLGTGKIHQNTSRGLGVKTVQPAWSVLALLPRIWLEKRNNPPASQKKMSADWPDLLGNLLWHMENSPGPGKHPRQGPGKHSKPKKSTRGPQ